MKRTGSVTVGQGVFGMSNIFISIVLSCFFFCFVLVRIAARKAVYPRVPTLEETERTVREAGQWGAYDSLSKQPLDFKLADGYMIHGVLIPASVKTDRYVVFVHGFGFSRYGGIKYLPPFLKNGYNVFLYDLRGHGANSKAFVGMGEQESRDLMEIISQMRQRFGKHIHIGLQGESLGAFTALLVAACRNDISFCVEDCAYSNTKDELTYQLHNQMHLPSFFYPLIACFAKYRYGQHWNDYDARRALADCKVPILFIHGDADLFTPPVMARQLYDSAAKSKYRKLVYVKNAGHALSQPTDPVLYDKEVEDFLKHVIC
jgi:pimeloyl-ACP methyl ester carboxylesterase